MPTKRDRAWNDYSERVRKELIPKLLSSRVSMMIIDESNAEQADIQQATELGLLLLMDKPIILIAISGATMPSRLAKAADVIITDWSADNPEAEQKLAEAMRAYMSEE